MTHNVPTIHYPSPPSTNPRFAALPKARIEVVQHDDGRWMWAIDFGTADGGEGYAPMPKWGRFAPTEAAARTAGIAELRTRLGARAWADQPQARKLLAWLDALEAPQQEALFS